MPLARWLFTYGALRSRLSGRDLVGTVAVLFLNEIHLRGGRARQANAAEAGDEEVPEAESSLAAMI